jgi:hypothetical protein
MELIGMSLLFLFHWLAHTWLGVTLSSSTWAFAVIEIVHLLALAVFGGAVLLLDLRFFGAGFSTQSARQVARGLLPLVAGSILVLIVTGILMVASGPMRYYYNVAFRAKILLFVVGVALQLALQLSVVKSDVATTSRWRRAIAAASLLLWLSVGLAGRAIGYV